MAQSTGSKTVLKLSEVRDAVNRALDHDDDWQAQYCEVAMIPIVASAWQASNKNRFAYSVKRVDGLAHIAMEREQNHKRCEEKKWAEVSGYLFSYGFEEESGLCWNRVCTGHYSHSASTTWDGIRRETYHDVIENAYAAYRQAAGTQRYTYDASERLLTDHNIVVVNDL